MFTDHSGEIVARADAAIEATLRSMGDAAVPVVRETMAAYPDPILDTGALMADVSWAADARTLRIGNSLPYAAHVHDGTLGTAGRPYLVDGLAAALPGMESICHATLAAALSG